MEITAHNAETAAFAQRLNIALSLGAERTGISPTSIEIRIATACDVPRDTVRGWLAGYSIPEIEHLEPAIKSALQDPECYLKPQAAPLIRSVEKAWYDAYDSVGRQPLPAYNASIARAAARKLRPPKASELTAPDSPGMPPRYWQGEPERLVTLDTEELREIQRETEHFPEFVQVSRLLKGLTPNEFAQATPHLRGVKSLSATRARQIELGTTKAGTQLPRPDMRDAMLSALCGDDNALFTRGQNLHRGNQARMIAECERVGKLEARVLRESNADADYFQEKLEQYHASLDLPRVDAPQWAAGVSLPRIATKGEYLATAAKALECEPATFLAEEGIAPRVFEKVTRSSPITDNDTLPGIFFDCLAKFDTQGLMNRTAFDSLPYRNTQHHLAPQNGQNR